MTTVRGPGEEALCPGISKQNGSRGRKSRDLGKVVGYLNISWSAPYFLPGNMLSFQGLLLSHFSGIWAQCTFHSLFTVLLLEVPGELMAIVTWPLCWDTVDMEKPVANWGARALSDGQRCPRSSFASCAHTRRLPPVFQGSVKCRCLMWNIFRFKYWQLI